MPTRHFPPEREATTPCGRCPLRNSPLFRARGQSEVHELGRLKHREVQLSAGDVLIDEGQPSDAVFTLLRGWAYRFKTLADGRKQILRFVLPGDLVGIQHAVTGSALHGVRALTDATFCMFGRELLGPESRPAWLTSDVTWLIAHEEAVLDEQLLSIGRRTAAERLAALLLVTFWRAAALEPDRGVSGVPFPITQQHLADTLGLSLVHTNKTLRRLEALALFSISRGRLVVSDPRALARLANMYSDGRPPLRPLI